MKLVNGNGVGHDRRTASIPARSALTKIQLNSIPCDLGPRLVYLNSGCTSKLDKNGGGAPRQTRLPDGEVTAATKTNVRQRRRRTEMRIGIRNRVDIQIR